MENTSSTAVMEKPKKKRGSDASPVTSMADKNSDIAPEKRRLFRKACNHTARTVLFEILMLNLVAGAIMGVYMALHLGADAMNSIQGGNLDAINDSMNNMISEPSYWLWTIISNLVGALCANLLAAFLHSNTRGYKLFEGFKEGRLTFKLFCGGLFTAIGAMYAWAYLYALIQFIFKFSDPMAEASNSQAEILLSKDNLAGLIIYCLYFCIIAPVTEELLFRGVLLKTLSKYNIVFAALVSSLFFGLVHGNLNQTPGAFLAGLALAYVAIRSGSLRGSVIIHMIINSFSTAVGILSVNYAADEKMMDYITYGSTGLTVAFIIAGLVIVIACAKKLKWEAVDPTTNHILLPKVNTRVKYRFAHFITCFWVLVLFYVSAELISFTLTGGFFTEKLVALIAGLIQNR